MTRTAEGLCVSLTRGGKRSFHEVNPVIRRGY